eukprot:gene8435-9922_t
MPQPIGFNATLSAPHMAGVMLDLLGDKIKTGGTVLDIGSGSGYITACLSKLVGCDGHVVAVDHIPELVELAIDNIGRCDKSLLNNIEMHVGDGFDGWASNAPYDAIYVGAAAPTLPDTLVSQLALGGRMVIPVGPSTMFHQLLVVDKLQDGSVAIKSCGTVRFVPLTSKAEQLSGDNCANSTKVFQGSNQERYLIRAHVIPAPDSQSNYKEYEEKYNQQLSETQAFKDVAVPNSA